MLIGVLSDTHNRISTIDQAFEIFASQKVSSVLHCGDWTRPETLGHIADAARKGNSTLYGVFGNRDDSAVLGDFIVNRRIPIIVPQLDNHLIVRLSGKNICMYHGHHKPTLRKLIANNEYGVVVTGHTHKPSIEPLDGRLIINPGSTAFSIPRKKEPRSISVYDTEMHTAKIIYF